MFDKNIFTPGEDEPERSRKGKLSLLLVVIAVSDYIIYWLLVYFLPAVMIPCSALLILAAIFMRKNTALIEESLKNTRLFPPSRELLETWMSSWILTTIIGLVISIALVL